jgi:hypothetical protein
MWTNFAAHLPRVRRYADAPHFWRRPTLHVEYVAGLIDPEKLERRRTV